MRFVALFDNSMRLLLSHSYGRLRPGRSLRPQTQPARVRRYLAPHSTATSYSVANGAREGHGCTQHWLSARVGHTVGVGRYRSRGYQNLRQVWSSGNGSTEAASRLGDKFRVLREQTLRQRNFKPSAKVSQRLRLRLVAM